MLLFWFSHGSLCKSFSFLVNLVAASLHCSPCLTLFTICFALLALHCHTRHYLLPGRDRKLMTGYEEILNETEENCGFSMKNK